MSLLRSTLVPFLRSLRKTPVVTTTAALSLAVGLSISTAVFSYVNALFLAPAWLDEPERVVWLHSVVESDRSSRLLRVSRLNYLDYAAGRDVFEGLALYRLLPFSLSAGERSPQRTFGQIVSPNYFEVLGVSAELGRVFSTRDPAEETATAVVLSHGFWRRAFGADERVIGEVVRLNGHPFVVLGVAREGFRGPKTLGYSDLWVTLASHEQVLTGAAARWWDERGSLVFEVFGRLQPDLSLLQARQALDRKAAALREQYPDDNEDLGITVIPFLEGAINPNYRQNLRFGLQLILAVVLFLLLIACANIGSLLLNRALGRREEIATRLALGAGRRQLLAQLLTESAVLASIGLLLGLLSLGWLRSWLWTLRPPYISDLVELAPDWRVLTFSLGLTFGTTLLCGLAPALVLLRSDQLASVIRPRGDAAEVAGAAGVVRTAIIVGQLAVCLIALVGSGLFLKSLQALRGVDPGFRHRDVVNVGLEIGTAGYDPQRGRLLQRALLDELRRLPGVQAASLAELTLPTEGQATFSVELIDEPTPTELANLFTAINAVEPGYFEVVGLDLVEGRDFGPEDTAEAPGRVIVNQRLAQLLWPEGKALGRRFALNDQEVRVVGIARDARYSSLTEPAQPFAYRPLSQSYGPSFQLVLRSSAPTTTLLAGVRGALARLDPSLPVGEVRTARQLLDTSMWGARVGAALLSLIAGLAFVLATIGIYSTQSATIRARRREVALRLALGGRSSSVLGHVLRRSLIPVALGLVLGGLVAALLAGRAAGFLVGTSAHDPTVFALASLGLGGMAALAAFLTARRILLNSPMVVLKGD